MGPGLFLLKSASGKMSPESSLSFNSEPRLLGGAPAVSGRTASRFFGSTTRAHGHSRLLPRAPGAAAWPPAAPGRGLPAPLPPLLPHPQDGPGILLISGVWGRWPGPLCFLHAQQSLWDQQALVVLGEAQILVSPLAFSLLFLLVLQGPQGPRARLDRAAQILLLTDMPPDRRASRPLRARTYPWPFCEPGLGCCRHSASLYLLSSTYLPDTSGHWFTETVALCSSR